MSIPHPLKHGVVAVSSVLALLAAAPSQAAVSSPGAIIGSFDPPFGPDIPNLGFRGTFSLNVFGCDPGAGGGYSFTGVNGCSITVNQVTLNFYNSTENPAGDPNGPGGYIRTYTLGSSNSDYPNAFQQGYVEGAFYDQNDRLVGFDTEDSNTFSVSVFDTTSGRAPIQYSGDMLLYFVSGRQPEQPISTDPAFLVDCNTPVDPTSEEQFCSRDNSVNSNGARVTINGVTEGGAVPEPGTVPLAAVGFGALIAHRWRRRSSGRRDVS